MSQFATKLIYEDIDGSRWRLITPLVYESAIAGPIKVPAGFETDLASIPRFFHRVIPKSGLHNYAAVVHDYLYSSKELNKDMADSVFYEAMIARGVGRLKAWTMWRAVKHCGGSAWNSN